jgi:hypothetical protein
VNWLDRGVIDGLPTTAPPSPAIIDATARPPAEADAAPA